MPDTAQSIVDLAAYPIARAGSPERAQSVARFRGELERQQYCVLPGFVGAEMCKHLVEEVKQRLPNAYGNASRRNCYLQRNGDDTLPADHPSNIMFDASYRMLAYDLFEEGSLLRALYTWEPLRTFVARVSGLF